MIDKELALGLHVIEFEDVLEGERQGLHLCQPLLRMLASMEAESSRIVAADMGERVVAAARHV
jgi:hypothetical protein